MRTAAAVGLIGLGLLGQALAHRLRGAGFEVVGFDVDPAKNARLAELGGQPASSVADLAQALRSASCWRCSAPIRSRRWSKANCCRRWARAPARSCCAPAPAIPIASRPWAERVATRGLRLLETPVSGSSGQVSRGEGVGLIGGDPHVVAEVEPVLRAMFPTYFHIGKIGDGGRAKLAVNLILGLNRLALAEGLVFAERLGLDPEAFLKVARSSAAYSQVMDVKGAKMIRGEFAAEGRITQHLKDVHLMLEQAERVSSSFRCSRSMRTCWKPACGTGKPTSTTVP